MYKVRITKSFIYFCKDSFFHKFLAFGAVIPAFKQHYWNYINNDNTDY